MPKAIIFGAGLAGLSLATELVDKGFEVLILEKKGYLGGRASNTWDRKMNDPVPIGPHIFLAAYNNFLRFLKKIGAEKAITWERKLLLDIVYNGKHHQTKRPSSPRLLSIVSQVFAYPFLTTKDKLSNLLLNIPLYCFSQKKIESLDHTNVYDFLRHWKVSEETINRLWRFFVLSMLNVPLELCSAAEFMILLKHWTRPKFEQVGFVKVGLGDLYTTKAEEYINSRGGRIIRSVHVKKIEFRENQIDHIVIKRHGQLEKIRAAVYASTLNPIDLRELLPENILMSDFFQGLNAFEGVPYISVNLWFDRKITHKKFWALLNDDHVSRYMNTDFYDQSNIYTTHKDHSFITSNIIYSQPYHHLNDTAIVAKTLREIKEAVPRLDANLIHSEVHRIPYVIYAPHPGMRQHKLPPQTSFSNFYLGGDWTIKELTQCLESAVRSGYKCAETILKDHQISESICDDTIL